MTNLGLKFLPNLALGPNFKAFTKYLSQDRLLTAE